jgi:5-methylcytosine-specific restriction endonuclease McrA
VTNRIINHRKRQIVYERDGFKCKKCGKTEEFAKLEIDHIVSIAEGGNNCLENLQTLCYQCNMNKRLGKDIIIDEKLEELSALEKLELLKQI